jgi:hypothetical protein
MRPPIDLTAIKLLLDEVPEFSECFEDLLDLYDEDLTPEVVFMELAEFVSTLPARGLGDDVLETCFVAVERVAASGEVVDGRYLVAYPFLSSLSQPERYRSYFGPVTVEVMDQIEAGVELDANGWAVADADIDSSPPAPGPVNP